MNDYYINRDSLIIIPLENNQTQIYELDRSFIVEKNSMEIVDESCSYFGSSYEGRIHGTKCLLKMNYKLPIIIEDFNELILFPTCSPRLKECCWIVLNNVENYQKKGKIVQVEFKNKVFLDVNISYTIFENQIFRSTILLTKLHKRKTRV